MAVAFNCMNLLLVADGHYYQTPDGKVYADSVFDYTFYKRYLSSFEHIYAVVRAKPVQDAPKGKKLASGEGVSFLYMPVFQGPFQYVMRYCKIRRFVSQVCNDSKYDCAIFRLPASTSNIFAKFFSRTAKPFAVEVVIDPWENFGPRADGLRILNKFYQKEWTNVVTSMCAKADGASYVTKYYLQKRYPPRAYNDETCFTSNYSSVELADDSYASPRSWNETQKEFVITHASNYFNSYAKGHLTVMKALQIVRSHGINARIRFIGDGPLREEFVKKAEELGIEEYIEFTGRLANGDEVREVMRFSDLFILPTYAEGIPRVLLEAMSIGLPCLSSPICGIPEVLNSEYLFDFDDYEGFAKGIENFFTNTALMAKASNENLAMSKNFCSSILNERRKKFYDRLKDKVERANK